METVTMTSSMSWSSSRKSYSLYKMLIINVMAQPCALNMHHIIVPSSILFKYPSSAHISVSEVQASFGAANFRLYLYFPCLCGLCVRLQNDNSFSFFLHTRYYLFQICNYSTFQHNNHSNSLVLTYFFCGIIFQCSAFESWLMCELMQHQCHDAYQNQPFEGFKLLSIAKLQSHM